MTRNNWYCLIASVATSLLALQATPAVAATSILQSTDPILAIDADPYSSHSRHPDGENPPKALDGNVDTKYLNFGDAGSRKNARNSGLIVTPTTAGTIIQSMVLTTANDAENRDPASYAIYGTNDSILSTNNSDGQGGEVWTLISEGSVALPAARKTAGEPISFANSTPYNSYRIVFPELKNFRADGLMQIADVGLFATSDATGGNILTSDAPVIAIQLPRSDANSPTGEGPEKLLDGLASSKYLNFGKENSGFIVTPQSGPSVIGSFQITTANDRSPRDPASYELYGTNELIASQNFSQGLGETWTLISSGALNLPGTLPGGPGGDPLNDGRGELGPMIMVNNSTAYTSYKMVFPTMKDSLGAGADSMQLAEVQFYAVPEPTSVALVGFCGIFALIRRMR
jgi:hypothetical protein